MIVAQDDTGLAGNAIVLFRPRSVIARLYSIAVAPAMSGRGVGTMLLAAAEAAALARGCRAIRLEVHVTNHAAISRYRKSGYREFGRHCANITRTAATRCGSRSGSTCPRPTAAPPYFHQTTEFTCGPGLHDDGAGLGRSALPKPAPAVLEFQLWREASTIFASSGPGGCEPFGVAVALKRRGLFPRDLCQPRRARTSSTGRGRPTSAGSCR